MDPKKISPKRGNKRNERPGSSPSNGEDIEYYHPLLGRENSNAGRGRSTSKKRKTAEQQQQKITNFTSSQEAEKDQGERGQEEIVMNTEDQNATIMTTLHRVEKGMEEGRRQTDRVNLQLEKILSEMFEIRNENDLLRKKTENLENKHKDLLDEVSRLQKEIKNEKELRNTLEQYTRKDNLKLINLPDDSVRETAEEIEKKVTAFVQKVLGLANFQSSCISVAHRVGKFFAGKNRPVIVRLTNRKIITDIFRKRVILKRDKSNIFITEDLTKLNSQRLYEMKRHPAVLSAWCFQGKLFCKLLDLRVIQIEDGDLQKIDRLLSDSPTTKDHSQRYTFRRQPGGGQGEGGREGRGGGVTEGGERGVSQKVPHRDTPSHKPLPYPSVPEDVRVQDRHRGGDGVKLAKDMAPARQTVSSDGEHLSDTDHPVGAALQRQQQLERSPEKVPGPPPMTDNKVPSPSVGDSLEVFEN